MGFLGAIFGSGSGADYKAQEGATLGQANQLYGQTQGGLDQQQAFLQALAAQGGLQNQSSVFNQLQGVANGQGPNPAQAMLANATGQNIQQQAALMGSQRGASQNVGLLGRQAAQQGGALQQNALGQAAALQANQSLGALGQLSGIAGQQVAQQQGGLNALNSGIQNARGQTLSALQGQNSANAHIAAQNAQTQGGILKGIGSAAGSAIGLSSGGEVPGKPKVMGDSEQNDTVPAMLSPGEIVIPRSHAGDPELAAQFARHVAIHNMAKGGSVPQPNPEPKPIQLDPEEAKKWNQGMKTAGFADGGVVPNFKSSLGIQGYASGGLVAPEQSAALRLNGEAPPAGFVDNSAPTVLAQNSSQPAMPPSAAPNPLLDEAAQHASRVEGAVRGVQQGMADQAQVSGQLGQQQAQLEDQKAKDLSNMQSSYEGERKRLLTEQSSLKDAVLKQDINPERFLHNMSTGSRVATGLGMLIAGLGGNSGAENPVIQFLNKQIENDISAQRADLGKKQSLLDDNFKSLGDLRLAESMTKANYLDIFAAKLDKLAAAAKNPMEQAKLKQQSAQFTLESDQILDSVAKQKAALSGPGGANNLPAMVSALVPKEQRAEANKELEVVQGADAAAKAVINAFAEAKKLSSVWSSLPLTDQRTKLKTLNTTITSGIRANAKGQGSFSDQDQVALIDPNLIGAFDRPSQLDTKMNSILDSIESKRNSGIGTLSANQIKVPPLSRGASASESGIKSFKPSK